MKINTEIQIEDRKSTYTWNSFKLQIHKLIRREPSSIFKDIYPELGVKNIAPGMLTLWQQSSIDIFKAKKSWPHSSLHNSKDCTYEGDDNWTIMILYEYSR